MLDEETKAIQEVAKTTGKAIDVVRSIGHFFDDVLGEAFREMGGAVADWARYFRFRNRLLVLEKARQVLESRRILGKLRAIPPNFALPILEGASLEGEEEIQDLWASLIANAADPNRAIRIRKVLLEILRGLEPLDARILAFLSDPALEDRYTILMGATLNTEEVASHVNANVEDVRISLQTLARYGCAVDAWESTLHGLDYGYPGFRIDNPKSNFRLSHLGRELVRATSAK